MIPVGGIPEIAFFTMKVGVNPGSIWIWDVIGEVVRFIPAARFAKPEGLLREGEFGRWIRILLSRLCEVGSVHGQSITRNARGEKTGSFIQ